MSLPRGFKAGANRIAVGLRHQMDLRREDPISIKCLAEKLGISIIPLSAFTSERPEEVAQLVSADRGAFSASLVPIGEQKIILVNDGHSLPRMNSSVAHEIAHALLAHSSESLVNSSGCRILDPGAEEEANCLAGHILIPDEAAVHIVRSGQSPESACNAYGVSREMLEFRLNASGARKRQARWKRRQS